MGIGKGDLVSLFLPNVPHYVAAYYGALAIGATVVNFSPLYTAAELEHQVEDSGAKILFTLSAKALLPTALEVLDNSRSEEHTSELQSLMRISYAVFCLKKKKEPVHFKQMMSYSHTQYSHMTTLRY